MMRLTRLSLNNKQDHHSDTCSRVNPNPNPNPNPNMQSFTAD